MSGSVPMDITSASEQNLVEVKQPAESSTSNSNSSNDNGPPIPRLYHYDDNVLVFNEKFGNERSFAEQLNRDH